MPLDTAPTLFALAAIFGGYFWLLVPTRLPDLYDQYELGFFYDYAFRMNLPGVSFNNRNWPRILRVLRVWACLAMVLCPLGNLLLTPLLPVGLLRQLWLFGFLGSLFIPIYLAGRRL